MPRGPRSKTCGSTTMREMKCHILIERPVPAGKSCKRRKSFQVSLNASTTVITLETGLAQPLIDGVTLETPAMNFIKAVRVDASGQFFRAGPRLILSA